MNEILLRLMPSIIKRTMTICDKKVIYVSVKIKFHKISYKTSSHISTLRRLEYERIIGGYLMTQKWDIVIVGGGLAGFVAANYLAKNDLSILILEKGKNVGGRARTNKINHQYLNLRPPCLL